MLISLSVLLKSKSSFEVLIQEKNIPTKVKYELAKATAKVNDELKIYSSLIESLKSKYEISSDELETKIMDTETLKKVALCDTELKELSESTMIDLPITNKVKLSDIGEKSDLTSSNLFDLEWLIEE